MVDLGAAESPEERVRRFQRDFVTQWEAFEPLRKAAEARDESIFPAWREMMAPLEQYHFATGTEPGLGSHWSGSPEYNENNETLVRSEPTDTGTRMLYRLADGIGGKFFEYIVREVGGDSRITEILVHYSDPILPYLNEEQIRARLSKCAADAPFEELFKEDELLNHNENFTNRAVQYRDGTDGQAVVQQIGTLTTMSGMLTVWDYGWDNDDARPLARTVLPGSYLVERVTAFDRNASVRVRFADEPAQSWRPAQCEAGGRDTVGVDHGCICIADFPAYASMTPREKAAVYDSYNELPRPSADQFTMAGGNVGIACDSGFGDGSFAVYWGLDADENVVELVVDFSVLLKKESGKYRHL